jgi:large subunit ribosomal protein L1
VRGKKYVEAKKQFDREKLYSVEEAVKLVKSTSYSKFDGTMELHLVVKKAGTSANVTLPHQAGKVKKVEIANEDTIAKLKTGTIDFDILVSTAAMMPKLVPFARLLGPRGLMPNPKNGTLVADEKKAKSFSTGSILIKTEKEAPLVHTVIGKNSQKDEEIVENAEAILKALGGNKQVIKAYMTSSMSPSVKLAIS